MAYISLRVYVYFYRNITSLKNIFREETLQVSKETEECWPENSLQIPQILKEETVSLVPEWKKQGYKGNLKDWQTRTTYENEGSDIPLNQMQRNFDQKILRYLQGYPLL